MLIYLSVMIFLIGLCVGSFVNMLVYRTAVRYGLKRKIKKSHNNENRSFCDYCGRQLGWYENVPVISWILQGGKTRCCHKPLPSSYPLVELGTAVLFVMVAWHIGFGSGIYEARIIALFVVELVILTMLVFETVFDLKYMILPDFGIGVLVVGSVGWMILGQPQGLPLQFLAGVGACAFLLLLHVGTKGKGMGMGDVKLALFMGLLLGGRKVVLAFYIAFIVGAVVGVVLMASKKIGRKSVIPFGPFLILGTVVAWWWGDFVLKYL